MIVLIMKETSLNDVFLLKIYWRCKNLQF